MQKQKADAALQAANLKLQLEKLRRLTVIKPPNVSKEPVKPRKKLIVALALITGIIAAVVLVFTVDFFTSVHPDQQTSKQV
jgi:LPS O-antigen subunit length determinant protein (WzzB/FepE family)